MYFPGAAMTVEEDEAWDEYSAAFDRLQQAFHAYAEVRSFPATNEKRQRAWEELEAALAELNEVADEIASAV
jgi:hypothetical protein